MMMVVEGCCNFIATIATLAITTNGTFLLLLVPIAIIYYKIQIYYRKTNTEVARLTSLANSPILVEFTQAVAGSSSIRGYAVQVHTHIYIYIYCSFIHLIWDL
jgi:hypothetical protein